MKVHVIIVAAGTGSRFGGDVPKQYLPLGGVPMLRRSVEHFLELSALGQICVVIHPDHEEMFTQCMNGLDIMLAHGGETRKDSVHNGLKFLSNIKDDDVILIHDAARPFLSRDKIEKLIDVTRDKGVATLASPVVDTLVKNQNTVDRNNMWAIKTPQGFHYKLIMKAHENAKASVQYTDDTSMVRALGYNVTHVRSNTDNIKITTQEDWVMAEKLASKASGEGSATIRVGTGFDVHAFEAAPSNRKLILCGIEIEHELALAGHSDADVGLHAITDALMGAAGLGDIGEHFSPTDAHFKNMDSAIFLERTKQLLDQQGANINNIDVTLICETPKIGPYKKQMEQRIAEILEIGAAQVNVKATTTERLGFTGRGEGIAAQAIASITC